MLFALNCRMEKGSPSEALVVIGKRLRYWWGGWGTARAACPVLNSTVLFCVLKTRTLRMNPTRTTIAHIAHHTTCDVASTYGTLILGSSARILVHITWEKEALPRLRGFRGSVRHRWVMNQLSRCKLTRVLKTVEEIVWRNEMTTICRSDDLTVPPLVGCCLWNTSDLSVSRPIQRLCIIIYQGLIKTLRLAFECNYWSSAEKLVLKSNTENYVQWWSNLMCSMT